MNPLRSVFSSRLGRTVLSLGIAGGFFAGIGGCDYDEHERHAGYRYHDRDWDRDHDRGVGYRDRDWDRDHDRVIVHQYD